MSTSFETTKTCHSFQYKVSCCCQLQYVSEPVSRRSIKKAAFVSIAAVSIQGGVRCTYFILITQWGQIFISFKGEKILNGSLVLISSVAPSVKIQIMGGKVCLRCKGRTLLGIANKLLKTKSLLTSPSNVLPYYLN